MTETTTFLSFAEEGVRDEIIDAALAAYNTIDEVPTDHQTEIRRYFYGQDYPEAEVAATVVDDENALNVSLSHADADYTTSLPLTDERATATVGIDDTVAIRDATLIGAKFVASYPGEHEMVVGYYDATVVDESELTPYFRQQPVFFKRLARVRDEPAAENTEEPAVDAYQLEELDEAVRLLAPNPWTHKALAVLYEDTPLADAVLQRANQYAEDSDGRVTFPDRLLN